MSAHCCLIALPATTGQGATQYLNVYDPEQGMEYISDPRYAFKMTGEEALRRLPYVQEHSPDAYIVPFADAARNHRHVLRASRASV